MHIHFVGMAVSGGDDDANYVLSPSTLSPSCALPRAFYLDRDTNGSARSTYCHVMSMIKEGCTGAYFCNVFFKGIYKIFFDVSQLY